MLVSFFFRHGLIFIYTCLHRVFFSFLKIYFRIDVNFSSPCLVCNKHSTIYFLLILVWVRAVKGTVDQLAHTQGTMYLFTALRLEVHSGQGVGRVVFLRPLSLACRQLSSTCVSCGHIPLVSVLSLIVSL